MTQWEVTVPDGLPERLAGAYTNLMRCPNTAVAAANVVRLLNEVADLATEFAAKEAECERLRGEVEALSKPVSEWISVKEALPENGQVVIVAGGVAYRMRGEWNTLTGEAWPGKPIQWEVTHWMPLPTPPASEKEPES